jgi:hypothetical protein
MRKWLLPRIAFGKSSLRGWWIIMSALFFLWGIFGNIRSDFISTANQEKLKLPALFPQISWHWLLIIFLILTLIALFEGAYRAHRKKVNELQDKISELTKHQLQFEIINYRTGIKDCSGNNAQSYEISFDTSLRFENRYSQSVRIKDIYLALYQRDSSKIELEIKRGVATIIENEKWVMWIENSLSIPAFDIEPHSFSFSLFIGPGMESYFSSNYFLRIVMEAINQPPYYLDLDIDLGELRKIIA